MSDDFTIGIVNMRDFEVHREVCNDVVDFVNKYRALLPDENKDDFVRELDKLLIEVRDLPRLPKWSVAC